MPLTWLRRGLLGAELPQSWMAISVKKTNRDEKRGEDVVTVTQRL